MLTAIAGAKYATVNMKTTNPRGMEKPVELTMSFGHVMIQPTTPTTTNECNPRIVATGRPVFGADAPASGRGVVADIAVALLVGRSRCLRVRRWNDPNDEGVQP